MLSTQSLREQLDQYADGALSVEAFEDWLASESWDMRRWAPLGLQRLVEAIQVALIDCSDRKVSEEELKRILLERRDQLHRAHEVTEKLRATSRILAEAIGQARRQHETIAGSQSLIFEPEPAVA